MNNIVHQFPLIDTQIIRSWTRHIQRIDLNKRRERRSTRTWTHRSIDRRRLTCSTSLVFGDLPDEESSTDFFLRLFLIFFEREDRIISGDIPMDKHFARRHDEHERRVDILIGQCPSRSHRNDFWTNERTNEDREGKRKMFTYGITLSMTSKEDFARMTNDSTVVRITSWSVTDQTERWNDLFLLLRCRLRLRLRLPLPLRLRCNIAQRWTMENRRWQRRWRRREGVPFAHGCGRWRRVVFLSRRTWSGDVMATTTTEENEMKWNEVIKWNEGQTLSIVGEE